MPLDRRITLHLQGAPDYNDAGIFVPGVEVDAEIWAEFRPKTVDFLINPGGLRLVTESAWRVRWRADLNSTKLGRLFLTAEGIRYRVTDVVEDNGRFNETRRRFLILDGTAETT